ncbi:hypothetical protein [Pseudoalteromonas sp.]|uniref:hypothetical protein n=1 Tax=Pseudoalteromonas sp. TaxID=53249 RepID=UPI0026165A6E|nr:hypothetical protein [Pseudoalteromonas sp.]MCP4058039.1 hypothetical protein [Pseudoalteromonas sp.]MCP4585078.1 hypothetical protein [Pseudoalteromonas sp.]MCP5077214.1 hypothetical protein [Psychromonas sp.]
MKKLIAVVVGSLFCSSAYSLTLDSAKEQLQTNSTLVSLSALDKADVAAYADTLVQAIQNAGDSKAFVEALFKNNAEQSNVIYQAAVKAGIAEDTLVASALGLGIDPTQMLEPTAFFFSLPPISSNPPPPPPPPTPPTGGGTGGGGVSISSN